MSNSFSLLATNKELVAAAVTFVAVLAMSTIELIGVIKTIISIGSPTAANIAVVVIVDVPVLQLFYTYYCCKDYQEYILGN